MARYVGKVTSRKSIEEVFAYMADFSNVSEWDPSAVEARSLDDPGGPSHGSRFAVTSEFLGRQVPLTYEITEIDPPRRVLLRAESDAVISVDEMTLRTLPEVGTELTYDADLRLKGARRLLDPLFGIAFRRLCERARERMGEVLG
ncbi:MAG: hypothetical protein FJW90_04865 [Actinobacteria bacterium]|nr:hypothetical protein [Actinomycetota bacterium]